MYMLWMEPTLGVLWVVANLVIAGSYFWIGVQHLRKYGLENRLLYGLFIFLCGLGHLCMATFMGFYPLWEVFVIVVIVDTLTALVSLAAAQHRIE